ncbi:MAG: ABC transporter permease [Gemmatimonadetes bacterium]|nr:ABC transporter permease [Gemmatimonadota bacterium]
MTRAWQVAYRLALYAFPRAFRARWGQGMIDAFRDGWQAREATARRGYALRELRSALAAGLRERLHTDTRQLQMLHLTDVRYALRLLTRSPGFALLTVLVLAGGLGLSTFTFSFLYTAMIKPLPLGDGAEIVRLMRADGGRRAPIDATDIVQLRQSVKTLREVAPYVGTEVVLGMQGERRAVDAAAVDAGIFTIARTPARLGRHLLPSDNAAGAEPVIVLSHRTWEVAFGSDRGVIDDVVDVNGTRTRVVGVMPEAFGFPVATEAWIPLGPRELAPADTGLSLQVAARLAPGASAADATAEATAILQRLSATLDTTRGPGAVPRTARAESFPQAQFGDERTLVFGVLNLVAALILLLALVNVTNLLLARANERARETAVRMALGASTARLVMQGMWETIILCVVGGVLGTAGAAWGLKAITRWTQENLQGNLAFWWVWRPDGVTMLIAGVFVTVAVLVLCVVMARRATQVNVREVIQDGSVRGGSRREGRTARALVVTQVATVTLLMFFGVLSGIMARRLARLDLGFDATSVMQVTVDPGSSRYPDRAARHAVMARIQQELAQRPGVDGALLRTGLARPDVGGQVEARRGTAVTRAAAWVYAASGALDVAGPRLESGRAFTTADDTAQAPVVLVSRSLAKRLAPNASVEGLQVRLTSTGDTTQWRTIVGVVSDIPYGDPWARERSTDAAYIPTAQSVVDAAVGFLRVPRDLAAGREAIFEAFRRVDRELVPGQVTTYREVIEKTRLVTIGTTKLFAAAFAFALALAMVGSYGLMSRGIGLRTREIGVRRALGATESSVLRLLLGTGARQLGIGVVVALPLVVVVAAAFNHFSSVPVWGSPHGRLAGSLWPGVPPSWDRWGVAGTWSRRGCAGCFSTVVDACWPNGSSRRRSAMRRDGSSMVDTDAFTASWRLPRTPAVADWARSRRSPSVPGRLVVGRWAPR